MKKFLKMIKILDMQFIRYLNNFNRVTGLKCNHCFEYNHTIVFAVPKNLVGKAIGINNRNLEILNQIIGKRIKIVAVPQGKEDIENFVSIIVKPIRFRGIEIKDDEVVISSDLQNKASLIGKNKTRLNEMGNILEQYFGVKRVRIK